MRDCFSGFTENEVRWNPGYPYHVSSRRTAVARVYLLFSANVPEDEFILTTHVLNRQALTGRGGTSITLLVLLPKENVSTSFRKVHIIHLEYSERKVECKTAL